MIGVYDYTVILTYLSLISAGLGIVISLNGAGHPYIGVLFLLLCGLFDAFDGRVARTKKDRTPLESRFGIQIDSLTDVIAFGVLPACIGMAMLDHSSSYALLKERLNSEFLSAVIFAFLVTLLALYMLSAMIRLAWFNVTEEERQTRESGARTYFTGLPVTSAALIFPTVMLLQYLTSTDITPVYFTVAMITAVLFLGKFQLRKPSFKTIMIMVGIGAAEFLIMLLFRVLQ